MMAIETCQHVIEHGLVAKQFDMLEGAPNAASGDEVGGSAVIHLSANAIVP